LVDDNAGEARILARVAIDATRSAAGVASGPIVRGRETRMGIVLSTAPLDDGDGDLVPDLIDDCPAIADPEQLGCSSVDASLPCGNGVVDGDEVCDEGPANSDDPSAPATCTTACRPRAPCGPVEGSSHARVDPLTGHCYVAWPMLLNFTDAERACLDQGAHLAAVTSSAEQDLVHDVASDAVSWIGVARIGTNNRVEWTDGERESYQAFRAGEPSLGQDACVVMLPLGGAWEDRPCGWPQVGLLPPSPASTAAYVCEHTCGNGVLDPGEGCDPPGPTCTQTCRTIAPCTGNGATTSPATGACYFRGNGVGNFNGALQPFTCPQGSHLATPNGPIETETALKAIDADTWIAVRARTTAGDFDFEVNGWTLHPQRYHGFVTPDPDSVTAPACAVLTHGDMRGDGWRDRGCASFQASLCQRD
jgi:hypothetical protein